MSRPVREPVGLHLSRTAKIVSRAFDDALTVAGGSLSTWLVLVSLMARKHGAQRDLAEAVGVEGPTLTHHLNRMEAAGLVTRTRDPENRRVHRVELTDQGQAMFRRLRAAATAFDEQLREGLSPTELNTLDGLLTRLQANAEATRDNPGRRQ
jgi:MarR family transcriptional regulator, transcriptional regulator for hemolysin